MYENKRSAVIDFRIMTRVDGAEEVTEYSGDAICVETDGGFYASFEEKIPGVEEVVTTLMKAETYISDTGSEACRITLTRRGPIQTKMVFVTGEVTHCPYRTPVGVLLFDIETTELAFSQDYDGAAASAAYRVLQGGGEISQAEFSLQITYVAQA